MHQDAYQEALRAYGGRVPRTHRRVILAMLAAYPGQLSAMPVAQAAMVSPALAAEVLGRLAGLGWAVRAQHPAREGRVYGLTPMGRDMLLSLAQLGGAV